MSTGRHLRFGQTQASSHYDTVMTGQTSARVGLGFSTLMAGKAFSRKRMSVANAEVQPVSENDYTTLTYKRFRQVQPILSREDIDEKLASVRDKTKSPAVPKGLEYRERLMRLPVARTFVSAPRASIMSSSPQPPAQEAAATAENGNGEAEDDTAAVEAGEAVATAAEQATEGEQQIFKPSSDIDQKIQTLQNQRVSYLQKVGLTDFTLDEKVKMMPSTITVGSKSRPKKILC